MKVRPAHHSRRPIVVDEVVGGVLLIGCVLIGVAVWRMGDSLEVIVSAAALWVALVFFAIFAYDFVADLTNWPGLQPFERWEPPLAVRRWLPLVCLLAGLLVGHFFW